MHAKDFTILCGEPMFEGVGAAIIGVILGGYIPFVWSRHQKIKSYKACLKAEIDICKRLSETYCIAGITAPSYRLPTHA
jgi:hypothetical protein